MSYRRFFIVTVALCFSNGLAVAEENRGSPEQRAACTSDAFRLCANYIPDATGVEACLRHRKPNLSDACRAVFEHASGTASVGTVGSIRYRNVKDED